MGNAIDLSGRKFGLWTVVSKADAPAGYTNYQHWFCRCECGKGAVRRGSQMLYAERQGKIQSCQSCGTKQQVTHGLSKTPEYKVWHSMLERCKNPEHSAFADYGGRGIAACDRWHSFENFIADMGRRPSMRHSLDRIDNSRGYEPSNCRWTTGKVQQRNKRSNRFITHNGETKTIVEWAEQTGVSSAALKQRLDSLSWSIEEALSIPVGIACNWRKTERKDTAKYELNGQSKSLREWANFLGVPKTRLESRLKRGWNIERALSK